MIINDFSPHAKIHWEEDVMAIRVEWLRLFMDLSRFKEITQHAMEVLRKKQGKIWIADLHESKGAFSNEIQEYMQMDDVAILAKMSGLSCLLSIMPSTSEISALATEKWVGKARAKNNFVMAEFTDLESCKDWIKDTFN